MPVSITIPECSVVANVTLDFSPDISGGVRIGKLILYKNNVQVNAASIYWIYRANVSDTRVSNIPVYPLLPNTDYELRFEATNGETALKSFSTSSLETVGAYGASDSFLSEGDKAINARYLFDYLTNLSDYPWTLNAVCGFLGLFDSFAGLNPLYMWDKNSFDTLTLAEPFAFRQNYGNINPTHQPKTCNLSGDTLPIGDWWAYLIPRYDLSLSLKASKAMLPMFGSFLWIRMNNIYDNTPTLTGEWLLSDTVINIEAIGLLLSYEIYTNMATASRPAMWNPAYANIFFREYIMSNETPEQCAEYVYNAFTLNRIDFAPFYSSNTFPTTEEWMHDLLDLDAMKACARKWYDYLKPTPPKKRKGMPIWEYLRYTI